MVEGNVNELTQTAIRVFYIVVGSAALIYVGLEIKRAWLQYKRGALYDLLEKEKRNGEAVSGLSDGELADSFSKRVPGSPKARNGSEEG